VYGSGLVSNSWYSSRFCEKREGELKPPPFVPPQEKPKVEPASKTGLRRKKQTHKETAAD